MDTTRLQELLRNGETLAVEFKSDRQLLNDVAIYDEVVAFANTDGGALLIGVEDDGRVTGARPRHGQTTDPIKLQAAVFSNTVPNVNTRVSVVPHAQGTVLVVEVDRYPEPCATAAGKALRRAIGGDGKPQTVPFYPRDQRTRRVDLGLLDFSAQPLDGLEFRHLDPLAFERLRQTIARLRGDRNLLELGDRELAQALRLVETRTDQVVPNVAGLLLLGREETLREVLPTHEVFFQVLDGQGNVKVNDCFHGALLHVAEDIEQRFSARNEEHEVPLGMIRLPVPDYSAEGFREAVNTQSSIATIRGATRFTSSGSRITC